MPIYEEKLLCPLAIRFTQSHIRSAFRDGRDVEASCAQITARPCSGNYDLVLETPFPTIEIVRWAPGHRCRSGSSSTSQSDWQSDSDQDSGSDDPEAQRWFTYDNRRLYCLQRAALEHWPKRVAAVVQVMYTSNRSMLKRKFDSQSFGREIDIMRVGEDAPFATFSWRKAVRLWGPTASGTLDTIAADEEKNVVAELQDAPQAPSGLERMLLALAQEEEHKQKMQQAATPVNAAGTAAPQDSVKQDAARMVAPTRRAPRGRRFEGHGRKSSAVSSQWVQVAA